MGSVTIVAFLVFYLEICMREGNILHGWRKFLAVAPRNIAKPLGLCKYCMAFWVGLLAHPILETNSVMVVGILSLSSAGLASLLFTLEEIFFDVTEESEE